MKLDSRAMSLPLTVLLSAALVFGSALSAEAAPKVKYRASDSSAIVSQVKLATGTKAKTKKCLSNQAKVLAYEYARTGRVSTAKMNVAVSKVRGCGHNKVSVAISRKKKSRQVAARLPASMRAQLRNGKLDRLGAAKYTKGKKHYSVVIAAKVKVPVDQEPTIPPLPPSEIEAKAAAIRAEVTRLISAENVKSGGAGVATDTCLFNHVQPWATMLAKENYATPRHSSNPAHCQKHSTQVVLFCETGEVWQHDFPTVTLWSEIITASYDTDVYGSVYSAKKIASDVITRWKNSPTHWSILSDPTNSWIGTGISYTQDLRGGVPGWVAVVSMTGFPENECIPKSLADLDG